MADIFVTEPVRTPVQIGDIEITLTDYLNGQDSIGFTIQIIYDNSDIETRSGNLAPYMTASQIQNVQAFAASMRQKAESEVLGN